jgi:AAA+ superfamily predicted ATPase
MTREFGTNSSLNESYEKHALREELAEPIGATAIASTEITVRAMGPYGPMPSSQPTAEKQREAAEAQRVEAVKILDKDAFKLGDLNPLIHPTDLGRKESVDAVRHTVMEKIRENEGLHPKQLEAAVAIDPETGKAALRFVARFELPSLTESQVVLLEELVEDTYSGMAVRTRTDSKGNDIPPQSYPPTQPGEEMKSKTGGWYMGPEPYPASALSQGLFVFKDYGPIDKTNFLDDSQTPRKYIVEVREANQYQTDLVTFITQVSAILGKGESPDRGQLLYETYYDLIRLGLKKMDEGSIYGMEEAKDMIMRELIIPLASPDISSSVGEEPQSVLMVGVPGTGKTLVAEWLLQEEIGLFMLPIDPFELQKEVALPKEKQRLMPRIAEIARITGKRVVLHVDDIENMVGQQAATNSTMLNLMAGVQESGFYIIASTNYPEQINPSLIQPQRFSVLIYCGLQNEDARYEILKIHANKESKKLGKQLFSSDEVRDDILREVAKHTKNFTPRYLSNIATVAKSFLVHRVAKEKKKIINLTEEDLEGHTFEVEDWERAFAEVSSKYDSDDIERKDQRMAAFVKKHSKARVGFGSEITGITPKRIFSNEVHDKVAAAKAKLEQDSI